jgi:hypothetical protein
MNNFSAVIKAQTERHLRPSLCSTKAPSKYAITGQAPDDCPKRNGEVKHRNLKIQQFGGKQSWPCIYK